MMSAARYSAALPCRDLDRAKSFDADKLGLAPADEQEGRLFYQGRSGTEFVLFASSGQASGSFTQMGFSVADIDAEVRELKQRGVQFEESTSPASTRRPASPRRSTTVRPGSKTAKATCS